MRIKNEDYVVVFKLPDDIRVKSSFTDCEILLNYNDLVAVFEEDSTISLGSSTYQISWDMYMNLVNDCYIEEMQYIEYLKKYRDNVLTNNPDAPVIITINESNSNSNETILNVGGANILIQRY